MTVPSKTDGDASKRAAWAPRSGTGEKPQRLDVMYGHTKLDSKQYGIFGTTDKHNNRVALDWDHCHCLSAFGTPGNGKTYACQVAVETAVLAASPLQNLVNPLAVVIYHFGPEELAPEYVAMCKPNSNADQVEELKRVYGVDPLACSDIMLVAPEVMLDRRKEEFGHLPIAFEPLLMDPNEVSAKQMHVLLGTVGAKSKLSRVMNRAIRQARRLKQQVTLDYLWSFINDSRLPPDDKDDFFERVESAKSVIREGRTLQSLMKPGRVIIVDMRDDTVDSEEAFAQMLVSFEVFSSARQGHRPMSKLVLFDEAHAYMTKDAEALVENLVSSIRTRRHRALSIIVASQDPATFPPRIIEFSDYIALFGFESPAQLKVVTSVSLPYVKMDPYEHAQLEQGETMFWAKRASEKSPYTKEPTKLKIRISQTQPGGATLRASEAHLGTVHG